MGHNKEDGDKVRELSKALEELSDLVRDMAEEMKATGQMVKKAVVTIPLEDGLIAEVGLILRITSLKEKKAETEPSLTELILKCRVCGKTKVLTVLSDEIVRLISKGVPIKMVGSKFMLDSWVCSNECSRRFFESEQA